MEIHIDTQFLLEERQVTHHAFFFTKMIKALLFPLAELHKADVVIFFFHEIWCSVTIHFAYACTFTIDPRNAQSAFLFGEILLQDIAKKSNILMDTAKSEICPVPLQNRVHLFKHTAPNILFIYQICGERRWGK